MRALVDLVFPPACLGCAAPGRRVLCGACEAALPRAGTGCLRCARPAALLTADCGDCRAIRPAFSVARSAVVYEGVARDLLKAFKLGGERRAGAWIGALMTTALPGPAGVITWVPASPRSRAARGFDPAEVLARAVARCAGIPVRALLRKVRETPDQASLGRIERRHNLNGAFAGRRCAGVILLVDDIMTTGATANECARVLRASGASVVNVLTFARAP